MYQLIDHTADVGLKIWADSLPQLFAEAGYGFTSLIVSGEIVPKENQIIELTADSIEELFHDWLNELNYLFLIHKKIFNHFIILELSPTILKISTQGETYHNKHILHTEIKAVTYHQLYVKYEQNQWLAQVFFDL